jgi:hypothetical protein
MGINPSLSRLTGYRGCVVPCTPAIASANAIVTKSSKTFHIDTTNPAIVTSSAVPVSSMERWCKISAASRSAPA